jgi:hypothetical protein
MSLDLEQFTEYVITPVLTDLDMWSPAAVILLLGTAAVESGLKYIHQIGGPALGIYQMEPATHDDIYFNYLKYQPGLEHRIRQYVPRPLAAEMIYNMAYATAMCRLHYMRVREPLPLITGEDMARYHKKYYNTVLGATDVRHSTPIFYEVIQGGYV